MPFSTVTQHPLTRRRFIQGSALVGGQAAIVPTLRAADGTLEGYASATSVVAGGSLDLYLRDPAAEGSATTVVPLLVVRIGVPNATVLNTQVAVGHQPVPADASTQGCRWTSSLRLLVPATWPSGLYFVYVGSGSKACAVPFVLRPAAPTLGVKTLVMVQTTTTQAYNAYGGKSLYDYNSSDGKRAPQVSLDRPLSEPLRGSFDDGATQLARWLAVTGRTVDFCTDIDFAADPSLLAPYQLLVIPGHDEYWTPGRRAAVDAFVARGGNLAVFSGNTMWFQSRLEPGANGVPLRSLVCWKDAAADPVADPQTKTVPFMDLVPGNPENRSLGLGSFAGCSWTGSSPARPSTPWLVMREDHWWLAGTGLTRGVSFGGAYVGYECDAATFSLGQTDLRAHPTGADGSPATLRILGLADATNWNALSLAGGGAGERSGYAMVAVFSRGNGTVFNAGSIDWCRGLTPEINGQTPTPISRITRNVLDKLAQPWQESVDVRQFRKTVPGGDANCWYGTETSAPAGSGMALDGLAFRALAAPATGTVPVYRFRSADPGSTGMRWRLSTARQLPTRGGPWVLEGVAFHAYDTAQAEGQPVYEHTAMDSRRQELSAWYSVSPRPPQGFDAGTVVFHSAGFGVGGGGSTASPSFTLEATPAEITLRRGGVVGGAFTVTVRPRNGFSALVAFTLAGLPAGLSARFTPSPSATSTQLAISASTAQGAASGWYTLTVTGTAGALSATTTVRIRVL